MNKTVERPEAVGPKINCYKEFELCYLRHKYFRKSKINPTEEQMQPFYGIIRSLSRKTYFTYQVLFQIVGLETDDIINIGKAHIVSFLGLFSVQLPENMDKFIDKHVGIYGTAPTASDFLNKDKADFTEFLKQRYTELFRIARQKVRNIQGRLYEEYLVYYGPIVPPEDNQKLIKGYNKLGFKKLDIDKFKSLKRKMFPQETGPVYKFNNLYYVTVPLIHTHISLDDLVGSDLNPYDSIHNMNPEEILIHSDTEEIFKRNKSKWKNASKTAKNKKIRDFIRANKNNPRYTEEVKTARRMVKNR